MTNKSQCFFSDWLLLLLWKHGNVLACTTGPITNTITMKIYIFIIIIIINTNIIIIIIIMETYFAAPVPLPGTPGMN